MRFTANTYRAAVARAERRAQSLHRLLELAARQFGYPYANSMYRERENAAWGLHHRLLRRALRHRIPLL